MIKRRAFLSLVLSAAVALIPIPARASHTPGLNKLLGAKIAANFNITTDQAIGINASKFIIRRIVVTNASANLTTAAGGVYPTTAKGGTAIVASTQVYTALTAATKYVDLTLAAVNTTDTYTVGTIYLALTTGQGSACTADVYIYGDVLP